MIVNDFLNEYNLYMEFFSKNMWHLVTPYLRCPAFQSANPCSLTGWGSRKRKPKDKYGQKHPEVPIKLFCCIVHHKFISFLPTFLLPRIHYLAQIVNNVLDEFISGKKVTDIARDNDILEDKTVCRWIKKITDAAQIIKEKVMIAIGTEFYTSDERLFYEKDTLFHKGRSGSLKSLWVLLKSYARRKSENRCPCHYAFSSFT